MRIMINNFKTCCLLNTVLFIMACVMMHISPYDIHSDPIVIAGYFVVYLELSKLIIVAATGADAPILIRYVFAAIAVGAAVKVYENMIIYDIDKIQTFTLVAGAFVILRWIAIISTRDGR